METGDSVAAIQNIPTSSCQPECDTETKSIKSQLVEVGGVIAEDVRENFSSDIVIWTGSLIWYGEHVLQTGQEIEDNDEVQASKVLPCTMYTKIVDGEPEVPKEDNWSPKLNMHLISKTNLKKLEVQYLQNTKNVSLSMGNCSGRPLLSKLLRSGKYAGCVHISTSDEKISQLKNSSRIIIILYSRGKQATIGFVPNDQTSFVKRFLEVIPNHLENIINQSSSPQLLVEAYNHTAPIGVVENDKNESSQLIITNPDENDTQMDTDETRETAVLENYFWNYELNNSYSPSKPLAQTSINEFVACGKSSKNTRFLKGCKWSPDGSCLISNSDDDVLRLFNVPESIYGISDWKNFDDNESLCTNWTSALRVKEGGQVYDYCWYPLMSSLDPVSSCFLTTSSDSPVHLYDAFTGKLRASYLAYNHVDEVTNAHSVAFDPTGEKIYCGFNTMIRTFDITRPGRQCTIRKLKHPQISDLNQPGIVSCIAVNPSLRSVQAVGSYLKTVGLYHDDGSVLCILQGHLGGVTQLKFSHDGVKLFSGGRKDNRIICWDMRFMGENYKIYDRIVYTNQRIYFDITTNDKYLITGGTDGFVKIWDLTSESSEPWGFQANVDCVNGVSINPYISLLATASGQRHFYKTFNENDSSDSSSDDDLSQSQLKSKMTEEKDIKLWKLC